MEGCSNCGHNIQDTPVFKCPDCETVLTPTNPETRELLEELLIHLTEEKVLQSHKAQSIYRHLDLHKRRQKDQQALILQLEELKEEYDKTEPGSPAARALKDEIAKLDKEYRDSFEEKFEDQLNHWTYSEP